MLKLYITLPLTLHERGVGEHYEDEDVMMVEEGTNAGLSGFKFPLLSHLSNLNHFLKDYFEGVPADAEPSPDYN